MDYPVTMQEVLQEVIERRVKRFDRKHVAAMIGLRTAAGLDYLRQGGKKRQDGSWQNRYISFQHMEELAKSEGISIGDIMTEITVTLKTMETERRPARRPSEARPLPVRGTDR